MKKKTYLLHLYKKKQQTTTSYTTIIVINNDADHTINSTATSPIYQERAEHQPSYITELLHTSRGFSFTQTIPPTPSINDVKHTTVYQHKTQTLHNQVIRY